MAYPGSYPAELGCGRKSPGSNRGVTELGRDLGVNKAYPGLASVDPDCSVWLRRNPAHLWINPGASQVFLGCSLALGWGWVCRGCARVTGVRPGSHRVWGRVGLGRGCDRGGTRL